MIIVHQNQAINLNNVITFFKVDKEIENSHFFKKDSNPPTFKYYIEFYLPAGVMQVCRLVYETKEERNGDFLLIIECYKNNFKVCGL